MQNGSRPFCIFFGQLHCHCEVIPPQFIRFAKGIEAVVPLAYKAYPECGSRGLKNIDWLLEAV